MPLAMAPERHKLLFELLAATGLRISEAIALDAVLDELAAAGFSVWGWDDETIQIGQLSGPGAECAPRHVVTIGSPDSR